MKTILAAATTLGLIIVLLTGCSDEDAKFKPKAEDIPDIPANDEGSRTNKSAEQFLPPPLEEDR